MSAAPRSKAPTTPSSRPRLRSGTPAPGPSEVRVASSRPFLPQSAEPVRGAVPVPADRPFELGHDEAAARVARRRPASEVAAVSRQPIAPVAAQPEAAEADRAQIGRPIGSAAKPAALGSNGSAASPPVSRRPAVCRPRPPATAPVSAFAGPAPANGAVMSGRGLY